MKAMVDAIRQVERGESLVLSDEEQRVAKLTHGCVKFQPTQKELASRDVRPTLWVVEDIEAGETLQFAGGAPGNIDSIRPGGGLAIRFADFVNGRKATTSLKAGTPLSWEHLSLD